MRASSLAAALAASVAAIAVTGPAFAQTAIDADAPPPPLTVTPSYSPPGYSLPLSHSEMTARFVATAMPNVDFLDRSSRLALDRSPSARIRAFAQREATDQTIAANTMTAWADADAPVVTGRSAYVAPDAGPLDPVVGLATLPFDVAADVTNGVGAAVTGAPVSAPTPTSAAQRDDLDRLSTRSGRDFDRLYVDTQMDALSQLSTLYRDYLRNGDDPGLRALAARQLPIVNARMSELRAL